MSVTKQQNKVPELRFSGFCGEWESKKLGDVGTVVNGLTYSPVDVSKEGVLVLRSSNVQGRRISLNDTVYVNKDEDEYNSVNENDILICVRNGSKRLIGKNTLITKDIEGVAFGAFMSIYRSDYGKFLFQWFDSDWYKKQVHQNLGATINSINGSDLRKFKIQIPSAKEQQKIADFLGSVDDWLDNLRSQKTALQTYKQGMMQKLFTQQIRFKDEDGNNFPDWEEKKISDISNRGSSGLMAGSLEDNIGNYPVYGAPGLFKKIDFYQEEHPYVAIVKDGSGVGRTMVCQGKSSVIGTLNVIKPSKDTDLYFLYLLISRINMAKFVVGGAIPHIYYKDYKREKSFVPSLPEQRKIANFLTSLDKGIELKQQQITKAEEWKKGLMQKMFV